VQVEGDDGTGRSGVGIAVKDDGRFSKGGFPPKQSLDNHLIHIDVGLVKPPARDIRNGQAQTFYMAAEMLFGYPNYQNVYIAGFKVGGMRSKNSF